jgi:hypothetical protein
MEIRTFAWTAETPNDVEDATFIKPDGEVRAYVAVLETAAREQGFSFAVYDVGVVPWAVLWCYDAVTGRAAVHCGLPECITPIGVMPAATS